MDTQKLVKKIAYLESVNDQLQTELQYLDSLARQIGFEKGIDSLKSAAIELYEDQKNNVSFDEEDQEKYSYVNIASQVIFVGFGLRLYHHLQLRQPLQVQKALTLNTGV